MFCNDDSIPHSTLHKVPLCLAMTVLMLALLGSTPIASYAQQTLETGKSDKPSTAQPTHPAEQERDEESKRLATVGMFLVVGITLLGVVLLGGILMWGQRIRRLARVSLPKQSQDEFWYLRPDKQTTDEDTQEMDVETETTGYEDDNETDLP